VSLVKRATQDRAVDAGGNDREQDSTSSEIRQRAISWGENSMSPAIRQLAIGWGGAPEIAAWSPIDERVVEAPAST
jgi:hypothetical protein